MTFILFLIIIAALIYTYFAAKKFEQIAIDKGYPNENIFWWCFFLPFIGYSMVIAMPDKNIINKIKESIKNITIDKANNKDNETKVAQLEEKKKIEEALKF